MVRALEKGIKNYKRNTAACVCVLWSKTLSKMECTQEATEIRTADLYFSIGDHEQVIESRLPGKVCIPVKEEPN